MKPIGALMKEHRLIERMLKQMRQKMGKAERENRIDPDFIDTAIDFLRFYADRTHHAKEEDILFRNMAQKKLSQRDSAALHELIDEHNYGRKTVRELLGANEKYRAKGNIDVLQAILEKLKVLAGFYQEHINKEDQVFFPACGQYFSDKEQEGMLEEFWESDRKMIHEKYNALLENLESAKG